MTYRLLLDENLELSVADRLANAGHDVRHAGITAELRGESDETIREYARRTDRIIITYDDDFVSSEKQYPVFYLPDESTSAERVATIIDTISHHYPQGEINGVVYAGPAWLY